VLPPILQPSPSSGTSAVGSGSKKNASFSLAAKQLLTLSRA
jgi:hypothetical protein